MTIRTLVVVVLCALSGVACAPRAVVKPTAPPPVTERQPAVVDEEDGEPVAPDAPAGAVSEARCVQACRHIFDVSTGELPGDAAAPWMADCTARCVEHASDGQLACYERVVRPDELSVCSVF
ncbi:MAG: hypothetical protein R3F39_00485 [Myxococcota bacterium]